MRKLSVLGDMPRLSWLVLLALAALAMPVVLPAQSTGLITGTVVDASEAVIPQAKVDCENTQTGVTHTTTTTADGIFRFPNLPIGNYDLTVTHPGFQELVRSGIVLLTGHSVDVTLSLELGSTQETVTVTAPAPVVQRTASVVQTTIDSKSVRDLPLNGRNALQLVGLAAGSIQSASTHNWQGANSQYAVNGNRGTDNTFSLDGVKYTDPHWHNAPILPNPDALEEFTVKSSNFDASQLGSGANVQYSMRSGTNQIHGSLFEFLRNDTLDARNFFAGEVTPFKRNQFGGTVGGPIIKDKTFFFASFQATRVRGGASPAIMVIPSTQLRSGDFNSIGRTIMDPLTGEPFANNRIPANRMDPINLQLLDTIPVPGQATGVARVPVKPRTDENDTQFSVKIDHNISSKDRLSGHWFYDRLDFEVPTSPLRAYYADTKFRNQNFMISNTHTFSPNLLLVTSFGYTRVPREQAPAPPPATMQDLGVNVPFSVDGVGPEIRVFINGYSSLTNGGRLVVQPTVQHYRARVTWMRSSHMVQFGGDVTRSTEFAFTPAQGSGNWFYDGSKTTAASIPRSGDSFADFLLGSPFLFRQQGASPQDIAGTLWAPWISDDWKVSPRFTLNLGIRWDPGFPPTDRFGPQTGFIAGTQSGVAPGAPRGLVYSGDPGLRHSILPADWNNLAPRVGFAWDVTGRGTTIVRSAYGIFYRPDLLNITRFTSNTAAGRGLVIAFPPANTADPYAAFASGNPFPAWRAPVTPEDFRTFQFPNPVATSAFAPNTRTSYVQQWNLTVERQIAADLGLSLAYVGNRIVKGVSSTEGNPALFGPGATAGNADSRRPFPGIASLQMVSGFQHANYHGLQLTVTKRAAEGLNLLGNYTYSKCMDNNSATIGGVSVINKLDPNQDYGRCDFNLTHVANLSFEYYLPRVRYFRGVFDKVLNHWELTSIFNVRSGRPFSVRSGVQNSLSGPTTNSGTNDVADQISANSARPAGADELEQWFNTAAFVRNALGTFGNSGRNSLIGPGAFNWDFGLAKHIPVAETVDVEFRFEAFNFLNRANFNNPNATQSSALFGKITSAAEPRVIQFGLKLNF